jgi:hypothetical protein
MKVLLLTITLLFNTIVLYAQETIEWTPNYHFQLSDFKSKVTEIGANRIGVDPATKFEFAFQMTNYEFMFAKNFNSKVVANFYPQAAYLLAPDSSSAMQLLAFAKLNFDLTELYARKFREQLFLQKGAFSNTSFFQPIYNKIQEEMAARHSELIQLTDYGRNEEQTNLSIQQINSEIEALSEYCKTCKPKKKKK